MQQFWQIGAPRPVFSARVRSVIDHSRHNAMLTRRMALDIRGPHSSIRIEDLDEPMLELPERLEIKSPRFARFAAQFAESFTFDGDELKKLTDEVFQLLDMFRAMKEAQLNSLGMIQTDDPVLRASAFDEVVRRNPVHQKLEALLVCCKQAVSDGQPLTCQPD